MERPELAGYRSQFIPPPILCPVFPDHLMTDSGKIKIHQKEGFKKDHVFENLFESGEYRKYDLEAYLRVR